MELVVGEVSELGLESSCVSNFYERHWKREIALSIPSFYKWQFTESPSDEGNDHSMVALNKNSGDLYGVMALNRRPFFLNGSKLNGAELTTWVVDEKHTGKGIGKKILKEIQSRYDVLVGMGITDMALSIYLKNGFRYIKAVPRYVKIFDFDKIKSYAEYSGFTKSLAEQWLNIEKKEFTICPISKECFKPIDSIVQKSYNHFSRNYDYLHWRFFEHPVFQYNLNLIRTKGDNKGKGCIVCTRVENKIENLNILHVLDFFGDPSDMHAAISYVNEFCFNNNIHLADFYCTTTSISKYFICAGWFSTNDDTYFQFPHLFHPLELRIPPTTSLIYWSKNNFIDMTDISRLYLTKQDCDLDRPTVDTYSALRSIP